MRLPRNAPATAPLSQHNTPPPRDTKLRVTSSLKGLGYLTSTISVLLLGIVAWKGASEQPLLLVCLVAGMASSIAGMCLRWISHRIEQKEKDRIEAKAETASPSTGAAPEPDDLRQARRA